MKKNLPKKATSTIPPYILRQINLKPIDETLPIIQYLSLTQFPLRDADESSQKHKEEKCPHARCG